MNDEPTPPADPSGNAEPASSLVLDLNFVPAWARKPPQTDPYRGREDHPDARRTERPRGRSDRDRRDGRRDRKPMDRGGRERERPRRDVREPHPRDRRGPSSPPPREERLPFMVSFIPEQERLAAMAVDIRAAQHAFPLPEVAHLFLNSPEWHLVKFEAQKRPGGHYAAKLYQSRLSGLVFADRNACFKHTVEEAMKRVFTVEAIQKEPPSGNFVCVARCRLSGELLGPPNHHDYAKRVEEIHRTRYAHMSVDEYRRNIETVRDPELIERWKEESRTHTVYRLTAGGDSAEPMDHDTARAHVEEHVAPKKVIEIARVVLPGRVSRDIQDPGLLRMLRAAWMREQKFPVTLIRALRGAFRRMGLHLFDTKEGHTFVTAVRPKAIDPGHVVQDIREALEWIKAHPGCSRQDLVQGVRPSAGDDPVKMAAVLQPLTWLIEKGHVIEFYNGTLATPKDSPVAQGPAVRAKG